MKNTIDLFRIWNQRNPNGNFRMDPTFRYDFVTVIGEAREINYTSTKYARECLKCGWIGVPEKHRSKMCEECGGRTQPSDGACDEYTHDFESRPAVYAPARDGISVLDLLRVPSWKCKNTFLGFADNLTIKGDGLKTYNFRRGTLLGAPNDRTLVIARETGHPLIIKGGKMRVTADGIEN